MEEEGVAKEENDTEEEEGRRRLESWTPMTASETRSKSNKENDSWKSDQSA